MVPRAEFISRQDREVDEPVRLADKLSDRTPNPISYLSEGTGLRFLNAAPLGSTVLWPLTLPATPARGQGSWASPPCGEESTVKTTLGAFPLCERHRWGVQVRACSDSLGSPCKGTVKYFVDFFFAFSPCKTWWGTHKYV